MLGVQMLVKKEFAAAAAALVAAVAFTGVVGQVPSSAATVRPYSTQTNDGCDGGNPPAGYSPAEQFDGSNSCAQCQAHKLDVGPGYPTFCGRQNDVQAILWYGPHLG
jgi:hypothetical protein